MIGRGAFEAAVILVGVMLALAADRWVMSLDERAQESDVVERLVADLQADSATIATGIETARTQQVFAVRLLQEGPSTGVEHPATFLAGFQTVGWSASLEFARETWDDLIATGRSSLIRDPESRRALSRYYNRTEYVSWLDSGWNEQSRRYGDRARGVLPVRVMLSAMQSHPWWGEPPETLVPVDISEDDVDGLWRSLAVNEELRAELGQLVVVYQGKTNTYYQLLAQLDEVLNLLRGAL